MYLFIYLFHGVREEKPVNLYLHVKVSGLSR